MYSAEDIDEQLTTAMVSFGESNVTLEESKNNTLIFELSKILLWYRPDFYKSKKSIPALIYTCIMMSDDKEPANIILKYFDKNEEIEKIPIKTTSEGLMIWNKDKLEKLLTLKKGMKFIIKWKVYDWGTNSA